jgi:hypothetical protein
MGRPEARRGQMGLINLLPCCHASVLLLTSSVCQSRILRQGCSVAKACEASWHAQWASLVSETVGKKRLRQDSPARR